jgi:DNA-binding HxlR family transcriptional regulator
LVVTVELRSDCAVAATLDLVGDRWTLLIVRDLLFGGELRYGEFLTAAEGIPTNTLADRLRKLEAAGLVSKELYSEHPPRARYRLTKRGRALGPVLDALADWGVANVAGTRRLGDFSGPRRGPRGG